MTFEELKAAVSARGFSGDDWTDAFLGQYVNQARAELDDTELWKYREASVSGAAPLIIPDLGTVEMVLDLDDSNRQIRPAQYGELVGRFGDLSVNGSPSFYYTAWPGDDPVVAVYPESTSEIGVQYWRVTPDLDDDEDVPLSPSRFHKIIVDMAVRDAYRKTDNHQAAEAVQVQIDRDLNRMRQVMFTDQLQGPDYIQIVAGSEDS